MIEKALLDKVCTYIGACKWLLELHSDSERPEVYAHDQCGSELPQVALWTGVQRSSWKKTVQKLKFYVYLSGMIAGVTCRMSHVARQMWKNPDKLEPTGAFQSGTRGVELHASMMFISAFIVLRP